MGEFLKAMPKNEGRAGAGRPSLGSAHAEPPKSETPTLAEIGITKKQSHVAQKLASIPVEEFAERVAVAKASGGRLLKFLLGQDGNLHDAGAWPPLSRAQGQCHPLKC